MIRNVGPSGIVLDDFNRSVEVDLLLSDEEGFYDVEVSAAWIEDDGTPPAVGLDVRQTDGGSLVRRQVIVHDPDIDQSFTLPRVGYDTSSAGVTQELRAQLFQLADNLSGSIYAGVCSRVWRQYGGKRYASCGPSDIVTSFTPFDTLTVVDSVEGAYLVDGLVSVAFPAIPNQPLVVHIGIENVRTFFVVTPLDDGGRATIEIPEMVWDLDSGQDLVIELFTSPTQPVLGPGVVSAIQARAQYIQEEI